MQNPKSSRILHSLTPITYEVKPFTSTNGYKKLTNLHVVYLMCKKHHINKDHHIPSRPSHHINQFVITI
jgi:hypothetical protein